MNTPFREDYQAPEATADARTQEFDWVGLEVMLGEAPASPSGRDLVMMAEALSRLFAWLVDGKRMPKRGLDRIIGRRALAMVWVVRPDLIAGTPSLAKIAKDLGQSRAGLSWHAAEFSRVFGIRNRAQAGLAKKSKPMRAAKRSTTDQGKRPLP